MHGRRLLICFLAAAVLSAAGCLERTIRVTSEPEQAVVWLNGEEVGTTPVTTHFTWYGDYDVVLRKAGYETLKSHRQTPMPLHETPPLDLACELLPIKFTDRHEWHFQLEPKKPADPDLLIERARAMRSQVQ